MLAEGSACTTHSESSVLCAADAVLHTLSLLQEQPEWAAAQVKLQGGGWCPDTTAHTATLRQVKSQLASLCRQHVLSRIVVQRVEDVLTASPVRTLAALTCMSQVRLNPPWGLPWITCALLLLGITLTIITCCYRTTMRCRQYVLNLHAIKLQGHNLWAWLMLAWVCRQLYAIYTSAPALQGTTSGPASEAAALQAAQELCDEEEVDKAHAAAKQAKKQRQKLKKKQASTASQQEAVPFDILQSASDSQHSPRIPAAVSTDRPQRTASPVPDVTPVLDAGTPCQQDSARPYQSPPGPARSGPSDPGNHLPQDCLPSAYQTSTPSQAAPNKDDRRDDHADDISYDAAHSSTAQLQCMTGNNLTAAEGVFCPGQPSDNMCSAGAIHRLIALHPHLCCPLTQVSQGLVFAVCIVHKQACSLIASALYEFLEIELYCPVATIVGQS